uniref:Uncharacterized protein LOC104218798 n=1 Tax=Nicotiana sylvestris TaxID=4096 RepID=A0A1U7VRV2_NICSY|nr:PREDICTED: uncharacterized protein LOC104218798 [Nicotiana sylvestris]
MGQAREQVLRLAEKVAYVHDDHRRLSNEEVGQQACALVPQLPVMFRILPDFSSLVNIKKKPIESFREYAIKWREEAARVKLPMKEAEMIDYFLQAKDPDYLHYMLSAIGKPFAKAIKIGEIVENGMKSGKILS